MGYFRCDRMAIAPQNHYTPKRRSHSGKMGDRLPGSFPGRVR
ncbi:hypothetical protein PJF56_14260 [Roseofilum sp. BLCC_M91]|uniref:Uncharacterized protein n=1 Tax=Roseofilum halophilum BLCC-M91 TaxID=3022259 RepID=A0ABT7BLF3_9CYAN|nr:hypothetical protein [Roseofilum halophilum]MDJ1180029.1 hypothetical protein [Roseofilum halophilum BLCC-M91]